MFINLYQNRARIGLVERFKYLDSLLYPMDHVINNVDLDKISQTTSTGKKDKSTLRKPVKLEGEWILDSAAEYQFKTEPFLRERQANY